MSDFSHMVYVHTVAKIHSCLVKKKNFGAACPLPTQYLGLPPFFHSQNVLLSSSEYIFENSIDQNVSKIWKLHNSFTDIVNRSLNNLKRR